MATVTGRMESAETEIREQLATIFEAHHFPRTLVPLSRVKHFSISEQGRIEIHVRGPVKGRFGKHMLRYSQMITACLTLGRMTHVDGIHMRELGLWVPARRIHMGKEASREPTVVLHSRLMKATISASTFALVFPDDFFRRPTSSFPVSEARELQRPGEEWKEKKSSAPGPPNTRGTGGWRRPPTPMFWPMKPALIVSIIHSMRTIFQFLFVLILLVGQSF